MKFCVEDSVMLFGFLCTGICFFTRYLKPYLHGQKNILTSILKNLSEKKIYKVNLLRYLHRQILHIFASFLVVVLWIISICHYIDSIPQFLRN